MKAVIFDSFGGLCRVDHVDDPVCEKNNVIIKVEASGVCRSDWHGWQGHDPDIKELPHVPGHEFAGFIEETGRNVRRFAKGDRVTVPFVSGCGSCPECSSGNHQICDNQFQPGFTAWGSFAQYVAVKYYSIKASRIGNNAYGSSRLSPTRRDYIRSISSQISL